MQWESQTCGKCHRGGGIGDGLLWLKRTSQLELEKGFAE